MDKFRSFPTFQLKIWIFLCLFVFGFIGCAKKPSAVDQDQEVLIELTEGWEYRWGDSPIDANGVPTWTYEDIGSSEWLSIDYNEGIANPPNRQNHKILWLRITLPEKDLRDPQLRIQFIGFACEAYLEKDLFYRFKSVNVPGQGKFTENQFNRFSLNMDFQNKNLLFRIYSEDSTYIGFGAVYLGSFAAFSKRLINEILGTSIFGILFIVASLFPLLLFLFRRKEKLYFAFGFLCLSMGFWIVSPTEFGHRFLEANRILFFLTSILPFLSAAGLCAYFEQIYGPGKKFIIRRFWQFFLTYGGIALFFLILKLPYNTLMLVMIGFFATFATAIFVLFFTSVRRALQGNREAMIISAGFAVLTFFGLYDILGGIFHFFPWNDNTYHWGMFVFIISLGFVLEHRFRQNAVELEKSHKKLQEYSQTLEEKVKARTQDLEDKKANTDSALENLKNVIVEKSRFRLQRNGMRVVDLTVKNDTEHTISHMYFHGVLTSRGRKAPWVEDDFHYLMTEGLDPGKSVSWSFALLAIAWKRAPGNWKNLKLDVTVTRIDGEDDEPIYDAYTNRFSERDQVRLDTLKGYQSEHVADNNAS